MELDQAGKTTGRMFPGVPSRGGNTRQCLWSRTGCLSLSWRRSLTVIGLFLRSQGGHSPFTTPPSSFHARFDPQQFRVLLLRRLWQPLPPVSRICRCGRPLDSSGHHRAACATSGVGRRGFAVESAVARVCREAGGRVSCNVFVRDLDVGVPIAGDRATFFILRARHLNLWDEHD